MMILRFLIALLFLPSIAIAQMSHPPGGGGGSGCNTSGSQILKGDGAGGCSNASAGTDFTSPTSTEAQSNKTLAAANNVIEADTGDSATDFFSAGTVNAARLPNLNTVATGLTALRCVETDASSLFTVAAGACGTGGGYATIDDEDTPLTQRSTLNFEGAGVTCVDDTDQTTCTIGTGAGGDSITVDGAAVTDPDFDDGGDIDFTNTSNVITATVKTDSVALGTDTTGNYAGSSSEGGAATSAEDLTCTDCIGGTEIVPASTTVEGVAELATAAETTTGTDATRVVTPDGLAGSDYGKRIFHIEAVADATALSTGDGKAYIPINAEHNGWVVVGVYGHVGAAVSSSGAVDVDVDVCGAVATGIRCSGTNRDLLSTNLTIDANEDGSETAAAAAVINTSNDDLATGEWLRINIDGAGTGTQGLYVEIVLQKP